MTALSFSEAITSAIVEEMREDPRVFIMGQDVELFLADGAAREEFGGERVRNTPISETGVIGAGIGAALTGMRPIVELGCSTFLYSAMDQIVNQAAKSRYMFGGQANVPLVIRAPVLYTSSTAAHHSDRPWGMFAHAPGLKIVIPATPHDAKGLLKAAIRDGNPVLCFEDTRLLSRRGEVPDGDYTIKLGVADVKRSGVDVTVVSVAAAVHDCLAAADMLNAECISVEVIDIRTVVPLDRETILESVAKTGRLVVVDPAPANCGIAAEIAATVAEHAFKWLKEPVVRLTAPNLPVPYSPALEKLLYPTPEMICVAVRRYCRQG